MTHAALVIQNGYRSYCEHKRFKKSTQSSSKNLNDLMPSINSVCQDKSSQCLQNYYKNYHSDQQQQNSCLINLNNNVTTLKEPNPSGPLKYV